jgi:hypothetical protein
MNNNFEMTIQNKIQYVKYMLSIRESFSVIARGFERSEYNEQLNELRKMLKELEEENGKNQS